MVANWGVNAILGLTAFILTFFISLVNNTWQTSSFRAVVGFLLFFLFGYLLRFILHEIGLNKNSDQVQKPNTEEERNPELDWKEQVEVGPMGDQSFQAVPLQSLHNGLDARDSEKGANTIRTQTGPNKEG